MSTAFVQPTSFRVASPALRPPSQACGLKPGAPERPANFTMSGKGSKKGASDSGMGIFGKLRQVILKPIVTVPGGGKGGDLITCVFCEGEGFSTCVACNGGGKDALGTCFMCDGKGVVKCTVCDGVGMVDRIRRGGTDDRNEYIVKKKRDSGADT